MSNTGLAVAGGCQYPSVTPAAVPKAGLWFLVEGYADVKTLNWAEILYSSVRLSSRPYARKLNIKYHDPAC